jgi:hypothetical protein
MDPKLSGDLKYAVRTWLKGAMDHVREHPEHMRAIMHAMEADNRDIRLVLHVRANAISIETADYDEPAVTEIFRENLAVPADAPLSESKH